MKSVKRLLVTALLLLLGVYSRAQQAQSVNIPTPVTVNITPSEIGCQGTNMVLTANASVGNSATVNGFTGIFDHSNWSLGSITYHGTVDEATQSTLSITNGVADFDGPPSEDCIFGLTNVYGIYNQNLPAYTISFSWSYTRTNATESGNYPGVYAPFPSTGLGMEFNGGYFVMPGYNANTDAPLTQTGAVTFQTSNYFGYVVGGSCYNTGTGTLTITNFTATPVSTITPTYSWTASNGGTIVSGGNTATPVVSTSGTYTVTASASGFTNGTDSEVVTFNAPVTPTFTQIPAICGSTTDRSVSPLPAVSNNGISGSWSPAFNYSTTTTYTFTPSAGQCASPTTMTVSVASPTSNGSVTTTVSGSYTWPLPYGTGLTYTTSQFGLTHTIGCNTATLNLTVLLPPVNTFTVGASCGATISSLAVTINTPTVIGATSYLFRVRNMLTNTVMVINRPVNSFALSNYTGTTLGTPYQIEVSTNGGATYGPPCMVTTPTPLATIGAQCGTTLTAMGQWVYATYQQSITAYRFRITNTATGSVQVYDPVGGLNKFNFNQLPAAFRMPGTTYAIEVALRNLNGIYFDYGTACNITTPGTIAVATKTVAVSDVFTAVAYPNPFAGTFALEVKTTAESTLQISVYDMLGRKLESKNVGAADINNLELGGDYPSGVYNLVLSQGENTKTLRLIKR